MLGACRSAAASPAQPSAAVTGGPSASAAPTPVDVVWQMDGGPDRLALPTGLAIDRRGTLTVVDAGNDCLVQLAMGTGAPIARLRGPGTAPGRFRFGVIAPVDWELGRVVSGGVAVDADGSLIVVDAFNARVLRLGRAEQVVHLDYAPPPVSPLVEPTGIAMDDQRARVYVADAGADRIHTFDRDGRWQGAWGGPGPATGQFRRPVALAVGPTGEVYVADQMNDRIQVFDAAGRFVTAWGGPGPEPSDFTAPSGVAVDGAGRVYVATVRRVLVFSPTGVFVTAWDGAGGDAGAFGAVTGIAVDELGAIYVTDAAPARVLKFRPRGPWPTPAAGRPTPRPTTLTATPAPLLSPPPMTPTDR